jgi:hypothetical protein
MVCNEKKHNNVAIGAILTSSTLSSLFLWHLGRFSTFYIEAIQFHIELLPAPNLKSSDVYSQGAILD